MKLDVLYLKDLGKVVIHCETEDQADEFFKMIEETIPHKLRGWSREHTHWNWYEENTCYALHLDKEDDQQMQFSPTYHWRANGYRILQFSDLIVPHDLGEIEQDANMTTNLLYEIGV